MCYTIVLRKVKIVRINAMNGSLIWKIIKEVVIMDPYQLRVDIADTAA